MMDHETKYGLREGTTTTLTLDEDEYITGVEGYANSSYVTQLTFVTNKRTLRHPAPSISGEKSDGGYCLGTSNPHGVGGGEYFKWGNIGTLQESQRPHMRLLAFGGRA